MSRRIITTLLLTLAATLAATGCTRTENVDIIIPAIPLTAGNQIIISDIVGADTNDLDKIRIEITGLDWQVIATVEAEFTDGAATLTLPVDIPEDELCKATRESYNDYEGYWPAQQTDDPAAKVAGFQDIIAYKGETRVGRLYLTDWNGAPKQNEGKYFVYYHYSDRPFALSGYNLMPSGQRSSFRYEASFTTGWNAYAYVNKGSLSVCTTDIPPKTALRWRFEKWTDRTATTAAN